MRKVILRYFKNAERFGKQRVNTFAPQTPAMKGCPHLLRCGVNTFAPQTPAMKGCPHFFAVWEFPNWNPKGKKQKFHTELLLYTSVFSSKVLMK